MIGYWVGGGGGGLVHLLLERKADEVEGLN